MTDRSVTTIAVCNVYDELNRDNRLFEQAHTSIGDNLLKPFARVRDYARTRGVRIATVSVLLPGEIDAYLFIDMPGKNNPHFRRAVASGKPMFLMVQESPLVISQDYSSGECAVFRKIFTYNDSLVDGRRFIKINYAFDLPDTINRDLTTKQKLCTMIAGNKSSDHPLELYSERIAAIRWFENNHPDQFDLYGVGWDEYRFRGPLPVRLLNRLRPLRRLLAPRYPSYRGRLAYKRQVLARYRFAICYENIRDIPGYITEKPFDCLIAGTVPVYLGASNVADHIPVDCFVDRRNFSDYAELYRFMSNMDDVTYLAYLERIESYLKSSSAYPFTSDYLARTIIEGILGE